MFPPSQRRGTIANVFRWLLVRCALLVFGVLLAVLTAEGLLQLATILRIGTGGSVNTAQIRLPGGLEGRRILCVGDSNTYGLWVAEQDAYPAVLERIWNAKQAPRTRIAVTNTGFPGTSSSSLRNRLPTLLSMVRPAKVIILVGANDYWTVPEPVADSTRLHRVEHWMWRTFRSYRLIFILARALKAPPFELPDKVRLPNQTLDLRGAYASDSLKLDDLRKGQATLQYGNDQLPLDWQAAASPSDASGDFGLAANLEAIIGIVKDFGAEPVILTYPADVAVYGAANRTIRSVAQLSRVTLIDLSPIFATRCPGWRCEELYPDYHPTSKGYLLVARSIAGELEEQVW